MDTSRLIINTIDKSSYNIENTTSVSGFTVVEAPKGPIYPVRIPAGGAAKIQDIFGVSSKDYPELFEVETFNKEYDVYVSAPYLDGTKVNAAYVTDDGIFTGSNSVSYDSELESVILGMDDEFTVKIDSKFGLKENSVNVLKDYRYSFSNSFLKIGNYKGERTGTELLRMTVSEAPEGSIFLCTEDSGLQDDTQDSFYTFKKGKRYISIVSNESIAWGEFNDLGESEYPGYAVDTNKSNRSVVLINTGIPYKFIKGKAFSFKIRGISSTLNDTFNVVPKNNGSGEYTTSVIECNRSNNSSVDVGRFVVVGYEDGKYVPKDPNVSVNNNDLITIEIFGSDNLTDVISQSYIKDYLDSDEERALLNILYVESISTNKVHGVICPKFASDRDLHISFASFDNLINYRNNNPLDRNILKMTVYEDGAFRDASHKLSITGSLKVTDVDSNGASIGFSPVNSSYQNQDLIYVYTYKEFTKDDIVNTRISKYPSITVFGGERYLGEDSVALHNLGWEKSLDSEFSNVDIFFDSQDYSDKSISDLRSKSKFFSLVDGTSDGHNLAGYIFNYTVAPGVVDTFTKSSNYLSFGRNYWNICNMAVMSTDDGSKFFSTMVGARALMQCRIIENRWGGAAPMWENEGTPGLGGQLDMISPLRLRYKYSKSQLDTLDKFNYNPVINDRQYGIMVVGHKTCKPGAITDWSYIGHACAFFNFLKEVRANVMIPQIGKANNPYYRDLRNKQVSQYLRERLNGDNRIWAEAKVDTSTADGVNDIYALKALKFVINVSVKVDIFSEIVELNFTNEDQSTSVSYEAD